MRQELGAEPYRPWKEGDFIFVFVFVCFFSFNIAAIRSDQDMLRGGGAGKTRGHLQWPS